jgi:hypothetical protein
VDIIKSLYCGHLGLMEYQEMKKLINWPRKGLMESLIAKVLVSPLLWVKKSSGAI